MKRLRLDFVLVLAAIFLTGSLFNFGAATAAGNQEDHGKKHGFSVRQYEQFHDVLHPLQHDALPNKDFRRIRVKSTLLVKRGNAIVRLGVPRGVTDNKEEFSTALNKFREALATFRSDAKRGTDDKLEASYSAVHDSFELLAAMLPRG